MINIFLAFGWHAMYALRAFAGYYRWNLASTDFQALNNGPTLTAIHPAWAENSNQPDLNVEKRCVDISPNDSPGYSGFRSQYCHYTSRAFCERKVNWP